MEDWAGVYKLLRLALLAGILAGIAIWLFRPKNKQRFEEPAKRMLEEDDR